MRFSFTIIFFLFFLMCNAQYKIASVDFEGTKNTKVSFLKKFSAVKVGMTIDSVALETDLNQIKQLPSIANATYKLVQKGEMCALTYYIQENFTLIPFANVYTSTNDEFAYRIGLQEFNLLGRNMIVGAFYQKDVFDSYGLAFRAPYLFSSKIGVALNYNDLRTQEPVFFDDSTADYEYNNKAFEVLGLYRFNAQHSIDAGLNFFTEKYNYIEGATNPNVPKSLDLNKYLYKVIYSYNKIQYSFQYLDGFKNTLNLQYVQSINSNLDNFMVGFNDLVYYRRLGANGNWASRLRLGLATNNETPFAPFAVDNNINLRGVGNIIDRGTGSIVLNTEYRHTLVDSGWFVLQGNAFVDAGSWRNPGGKLSDFTNMANIRVYPGLGVRLMHKRIYNAVFRVDYGYGITKNASKGIVFGIGQYF